MEPTDLKKLAVELKNELGVEARETLKLEKNSKGYNWEIKVFIDNSENDLKAIERLETINTSLQSKFSQEVKND